MPSERKLPIDEFQRKNRPNGRVSALLEYLSDIRTLRSQNYTLQQICDWLSANDVHVTIQALSKFLIVENKRDLGAKGGRKPRGASQSAGRQRATDKPGNPFLSRVEGSKDAKAYNPIPHKIEISKD